MIRARLALPLALYAVLPEIGAEPETTDVPVPRADGFVSIRKGRTWPAKRVLCKDAFAYSCSAARPDGTVGCLYETEWTSLVDHPLDLGQSQGHVWSWWRS